MNLPKSPFKVVAIASWFIGISVCFVAILIYWIITFEQHDASCLNDVNILGQHACPIVLNSQLKSKLAYSSNRPDEDALWSIRMASFSSAWSNDYFVVNKLIKNELHYRVEIRRTAMKVMVICCNGRCCA